MTAAVRGAPDKIRAVARLRDPCRRLPHIPTERERRLLARFEQLRSGPAAAHAEDADALAVGWRAWWREQRLRDIAAMADALPHGLVGTDRRLATYALAARLAGDAG
jgi:hypothetical protein